MGSRPDYGRAEVRRYLTDNAAGWLQAYRLDGLRLDATAYIRNVDGDGDLTQDIPDGWLLLQQVNDAIDAAKKRSTLGAALVLTAPGIPMLFQGQEFLEQRPFVQVPAPLDWGNVTTYAGILELYRDLIHLRRDWFATTGGLRGEGLAVFHVNDAAKVVAFHRYDQGGPGDDVIVVLNFANAGYPQYSIGLPRPGTWRVRFSSDWSGYDPAFGDWASNDTTAAAVPQDGLAYCAPVGIGPYTAVILSQDPGTT